MGPPADEVAMPFNLFRRGGGDGEMPERSDRQPPPSGQDGIPFMALTEEWRLRGTMVASGRLADIVNRREAIPIRDVSWAPTDGSEPFTAAPGLQAVDPYDLIVIVLAGEDRLTGQTQDERAAHRLHKVRYDVGLDCPPYRVVGTV
ncbi:MAG TPA: hypothetical protein VFW86_05830, partial [Candidatus Limnocylindrales bacterium]|nr:hypothetical protein [Candidatus Limnocylindrales bacterium]